MMKQLIHVRNSMKGIGLDFYSKKDNEIFLTIKNNLEDKYQDFDEKKIVWDIDNRQLTYPDDTIKSSLNDVRLILKN